MCHELNKNLFSSILTFSFSLSCLYFFFVLFPWKKKRLRDKEIEREEEIFSNHFCYPPRLIEECLKKGGKLWTLAGTHESGYSPESSPGNLNHSEYLLKRWRNKFTDWNLASGICFWNLTRRIISVGEWYSPLEDLASNSLPLSFGKFDSNFPYLFFSFFFLLTHLILIIGFF